MLNSAIFTIIFFKVLTCIFGIFMGFLAGKISNVQREGLGTLLLYFMAPVIFCAAPMNLNLNLTVLSITLLTFILFGLIGLFNYWWLGKITWDSNYKHMLGISSTTKNCGYFMIPIASTLLEETALSVYMLCVLGIAIAEHSIGFYLLHRGNGSAKESVKKVLKLPTFNAFILGSVLGLFGIKIPEFFNDFLYNIRITYSILGTIMIGLGLSTLKKFEIDKKFSSIALLINFIIQPILCILVIFLDKFIFHIYTPDLYKSLVLIAICPIAANTVMVAGLINFPVQKIASVVFISVIISGIITPIVASVVPF